MRRQRLQHVAQELRRHREQRRLGAGDGGARSAVAAIAGSSATPGR
jgi:hypothetical protein